jgi:proteasome lid subunit RPN8/RPN11
MEVAIGADTLSALLAAEAASPDREICGLLFGTETHITRADGAANVAPDPKRTFEIDPRALFAALRAMRHGGDRLIGHYHSHPGGRPIPSATDLAAAEPGKMWLILASDSARLWFAEPGGFRECRLVSIP